MNTEILEDWKVKHGKAVEYACKECNKWTTTPKIVIIKKIGEDKYWVKDVFCSKKCYDKRKESPP